MVGSSGIEPPTSCLSGMRSNRLSYEPVEKSEDIFILCYGGDKEIRTLDPLRARQVLSQLSYTPISWWTFRDSNPGPTGYEPVALTN